MASKKFDVVKLAKACDVDSNFNPKAVGYIRKCEGGLSKGEIGLLCSESTLRRRQKTVYSKVCIHKQNKTLFLV
jgi:hypothetical protein